MSVYRLMMIGIVALFVLSSCKQNKKQKHYPPISKEELLQVNRSLVNKDEIVIQTYLKLRNQQMTKTQTGLWYHLEEPQNPQKVQKDQVVTLNYEIQLLDSTICYSSRVNGPKTFKVGQGGVESGLEEGILLMGLGDKAQFMMPPHLAHGLIGDSEKIPARSILYYEVEVIDVKDSAEE